MEELEAWLKRMENGKIGEARTKELLIDRFWIMERSVDIDGADYIIQRRIKRNLTDIKPHRLGIVQAKYREELKDIKIKGDYVLDDDGEPREGFFLFVHSGKEREKKCWFFTSFDLYELTENVFDASKRIYDLGDNVSWDKYLVNDITSVLDKIDQGLEMAEVNLNNEFIEQHIMKTEKDFADCYNLNLYVDSDGNSIIDLLTPFKNDVREATKLIWKDLGELIRLHNEQEPHKFYQDLLSQLIRDDSGDYYWLTNIQDALEKLKISSIRIQDNNYYIKNVINAYNKIYSALIEEKNYDLLTSILNKIKTTLTEEVAKCKNNAKVNESKILHKQFLTKFEISFSKFKKLSKLNVSTVPHRGAYENLIIDLSIDNNKLKIEAFWWFYYPEQTEEDIAEHLIDLFIKEHNPKLVNYLLKEII